MKQITSGSKDIKLSRQERRNLIQQMRRMSYVTEVGKFALEQRSELFSFTLKAINEALTQAEEVKWDRANGNLKPEEMEAFEQLTINFLTTMLQTSDTVSISILKNMVDLDIDDPKSSIFTKLNFPLLED